MAAPGALGAAGGWGPGRKQAFGAAPGRRSEVWFTVARGNLSEVFYPSVDRPVLLGLRFLVAAAGAPPIDDALEAAHEVRWLEPATPAFRAVSRHPEYELTQDFIVDPDSSALVLAVRFSPEMPDLFLHVLAETHGVGDGYVLDTDPPTLFASTGGDWLAMVGPFRRGTVGHRHTSDLLADLREGGGLLAATRDRTETGPISLGAEIGLRSGAFQLALGFGSGAEAAEAVAEAALERGARRLREDLTDAWRMLPDLDRNVLRVAGDGGALARASVTVLRCLEDKRRPGAFIAAPTAPWGLPGQRYTRVWPRDLFHIASALLDAGDPAAARRALRYLESTQATDGSWAQNQTVAGVPEWAGLELDQVAYPILLAWRLGMSGDLDHDAWPFVRRAAAFLVTHGPSTALDRWEDAGGLSPSTLAAAIAALVVAAEFAAEAGEAEPERHLRAVADYWNDSIEAWTYLRAYRHYVRLSLDPDRGPEPAALASLEFLELVRRGLRSADDPRVASSLTTADVLLSDPLPGGRGWRRYAGDAYGEDADGRPWAPDTPGLGRTWPLLAGERAFQALAAGTPPADLVRALEGWAGPELMLPEQVWNADDLPQSDLRQGGPTGGAAPLGWAHAEYLRLLVAIAGERIADVVEPARRRYQGGGPQNPATIWSPVHQIQTFPTGRAVLLQLASPGTAYWSIDRRPAAESARTRDTGLGCWVVVMPLQDLSTGTRVSWSARAADGSEAVPVSELTAIDRAAR
ncbi:MAG: glycoside hydrolase family 15 protein [Candidatus Dormibacteraeota bacterium]|nr:glycoside hydrolase family 15 protein [Candidatus Dormibacteraeota bacterium]